MISSNFTRSVVSVLALGWGASCYGWMSLQHRAGFIEGEPFPLWNHGEVSGAAYNFLLESAFSPMKGKKLRFTLPFSYVVADLPGGSTASSLLISNGAVTGLQHLDFGNVGVNFGVGLSLPTALGGSSPDDGLWLNKAQAVSAAISGGATRELYEPGRIGVVPQVDALHQITGQFGVGGFARLPVLILIGDASAPNSRTVANQIAVHGSIGVGLSYEYLDGFFLSVRARHAAYLVETFEAENVADRSATVIEPEFGFHILDWKVDLGYTAAVTGPTRNNLVSLYLGVQWYMGNSPGALDSVL